MKRMGRTKQQRRATTTKWGKNKKGDVQKAPALKCNENLPPWPDDDFHASPRVSFADQTNPEPPISVVEYARHLTGSDQMKAMIFGGQDEQQEKKKVRRSVQVLYRKSTTIMKKTRSENVGAYNVPQSLLFSEDDEENKRKNDKKARVATPSRRTSQRTPPRLPRPVLQPRGLPLWRRPSSVLSSCFGGNEDDATTGSVQQHDDRREDGENASMGGGIRPVTPDQHGGLLPKERFLLGEGEFSQELTCCGFPGIPLPNKKRNISSGGTTNFLPALSLAPLQDTKGAASQEGDDATKWRDHRSFLETEEPSFSSLLVREEESFLLQDHQAEAAAREQDETKPSPFMIHCKSTTREEEEEARLLAAAGAGFCFSKKRSPVSSSSATAGLGEDHHDDGSDESALDILLHPRELKRTKDFHLLDNDPRTRCMMQLSPRNHSRILRRTEPPQSAGELPSSFLSSSSPSRERRSQCIGRAPCQGERCQEEGNTPAVFSLENKDEEFILGLPSAVDGRVDRQKQGGRVFLSPRAGVPLAAPEGSSAYLPQAEEHQEQLLPATLADAAGATTLAAGTYHHHGRLQTTARVVMQQDDEDIDELASPLSLDTSTFFRYSPAAEYYHDHKNSFLGDGTGPNAPPPGDDDDDEDLKSFLEELVVSPVPGGGPRYNKEIEHEAATTAKKKKVVLIDEERGGKGGDMGLGGNADTTEADDMVLNTPPPPPPRHSLLGHHQHSKEQYNLDSQRSSFDWRIAGVPVTEDDLMVFSPQLQSEHY